MKVSTEMSKQEKRWQAEEDARALARAKEEKQDKLAGLKRLAKKAK